jgi:propionate CoA-transferase
MPVPVELSSSTSVTDEVVTTAKVVLPAESLSGGTEVRDKVVTATEAIRLIRDGDSVVVEGFVGQCLAEELTLALEQRFLLTGTPQNLNLVFTVAPGDRQGRGLDRPAHDGLLKRAVGGHWGLSPALGKMAVGNKIEAHNLPQGVISHLFRDAAAGKPRLIPRVGLGTFVDPRHGGGKINERTTDDRVELLTLHGSGVPVLQGSAIGRRIAYTPALSEDSRMLNLDER